MNFEEALAQINFLQPEMPVLKQEIFEGAWQGLTYEQIIETTMHRREDSYDLSYIKAQGAELCRELTDLLQVQVRKRSFQEDVIRGLQQPHLQPYLPSPSTPPSALDSATIRWVGREDLVEVLVQRLSTDCRVLMLVGLTGIGKTALSARLLLDPRLQTQFGVQKAILCDRELPNFEHLTNEIFGTTNYPNVERQTSPEQVVNQIVAHLKTQPCLLVLDMVEELLTPDGEGRPKFSDPTFAHLLEQIIRTEQMPSRVILTSQEQPPLPFQGRYPERSHLQRLTGLTDLEALELMRQWGAIPYSDQDEALLLRMIRLYEGHPLALQVIAGEIGTEPYNSDIESYWSEYGHEFEVVEQQREAQELEGKSDHYQLVCYRPQLQDRVRDRIERVFSRLQTTYPLAYRLLIMAAIYRRPVEPAAWYRLVDDFPDEQVRQAFCNLERRYLIERERYQSQILYRQHSLIRCITLQHLAQIDEEVFPA
jgi:hypothetical protein